MSVRPAVVTVVTPDPGWVARQTLRSLAVVVSNDPVSALRQVDTPWVLLAEAPLERHAVKLLLERGEEAEADAVVGARPAERAGDLADLPDLLDGPSRGTVLWRTPILADARDDLLRPGRASSVRLLARASRVATSVTPVLRAAQRNADLVTELADQQAIDDAVPEALRALREERFVGVLVRGFLAQATPAELPALRSALTGRGLAPAEQWPPGLRVALYHLMAGAEAEVRDALLWAGPHAVLGVAVEPQDGREYWACGHLADGPEVGGRAAREWLDVTDARVSRIPSTQRRPVHEVVTGLQVRSRGIAEAERVLVATLADGGEVGRFREAADGWQPVRRTRPARRLRPDDAGPVVVDQAGTRAPLLAATRVDATVRLRGRCAWTGPDAVHLHAGQDGSVTWTAVTHAPLRRLAASLRRAWRRVPGAAGLSNSLRIAWQHTLPQVIGRRGPAPTARVIFETESGRAATGDARAISEWLREHRPDLPQAWIVRGDADVAPPYAEAIERQSRRHHMVLNRSAFAVDDGTTSLWLDAPPRLRGVLTGPGVPVHRIGRDDPSLLVRGPAVRTLARRYRRYSAALAPGPSAAGILREALALTGPAEPVGLPRVERVQRLRAAGTHGIPDLPADRPAVLYLPTVRRASREPVEPALDLDAWAATWGDRLYLLVHPHPQQPLRVPLDLRWAVRDLSGEPDLAPYLAAAALVISDYSSLIGDAVLLDVPVILHQPDRELFLARTRGVYRGPGAAGPVATTTVDLDREVADWCADPVGWGERFAADRAAFAGYWSVPRDGEATRRAVSVLLGDSA